MSENVSSDSVPDLSGVAHKCSLGAYFVTYKTPPMPERRNHEARALIKSPSQAGPYTVSFQTLPLGLAVEFLLHRSMRRSQRKLEKVSRRAMNEQVGERAAQRIGGIR